MNQRPIHFDFAEIEKQIRLDGKEQREKGMAAAENDEGRCLVDIQTNENSIDMTVAFNRWLVEAINNEVPTELIFQALVALFGNSLSTAVANIASNPVAMKPVAGMILNDIAELLIARVEGRTLDGTISDRREIPGKEGGNG